MRWPWLAGSAALHLLVVALVIGLVGRSPVSDPAPALEVDLVAAPPAAAAATAPASVPLPDAPMPVAAAPPPPAPPPQPETPPSPITELPPPPPTMADAAPPPEPAPPPAPTVPPPDIAPRPAPAPKPRPAVARAVPQRPERRAAAPAMAAAAMPAPAAAGMPKPAAAAAPPSDWDQLVSAWLAAHRHYPEMARRRGETGAVTLRINVAADGRVVEVTVVDANGAQDLTAAAVALLTGATLPAPEAPMVRTVRIRYRLED